MLRAVSSICLESRAYELISLSRRDLLFSGFRRGLHSATPRSAQTVLTSETDRTPPPPAGAPPSEKGAPPPPPDPPRRTFPSTAVAIAAVVSIGGIYLYRKFNDDSTVRSPLPTAKKKDDGPKVEPPIPATGAAFPAHVQYLLVGAGTAAFAAMRAIRSNRPEAKVLMVGDERVLPYMRPPISKELWREPDLAERASHPDALTFRQWNGKRRPVVYEPSAFYTPVEELGSRENGGASVARGWSVTKLDVQHHKAELTAPGQEPVTIQYDKCLVATGVRARRVPALREAASKGRSPKKNITKAIMPKYCLKDAARLAAALDDPKVNTVAVVGGGFLATELSAALADRLQGSEKKVIQLLGENAPMAGVLPQYLARDAARRLEAAGVTLLTGEEVVSASMADKTRVKMQLTSGAELVADLVVECVGSEMDTTLAKASGLETHPDMGGLLVNAELQARADVWAAGDAACFYDVVLGRRRVEHHDHAVVSGRLAGENMAAVKPPKHYTHQSMFWSDLGPQLGYEAIGIIDSRLPTVGVFSADAVTDVNLVKEAASPDSSSTALSTQPKTESTSSDADSRRYERGVVFYLREQRVVGVLLWNLFNRMHVARQVIAQGEFEDLFEVGKLFAPHEEE
ncbi:apoptosis-inducing factor, mitochondrion-associated, c-term domain-containing protein [Phthorimaea operculella]|nr:apoptosis-inducing factor, mitochondrion-associated, c-term domain-containing protein [Phthorimaea operculella]